MAMRIWRSLIVALPLSLALWAGIFAGARAAVPADERHAVKAYTHAAIAVLRHHAYRALSTIHNA